MYDGEGEGSYLQLIQPVFDFGLNARVRWEFMGSSAMSRLWILNIILHALANIKFGWSFEMNLYYDKPERRRP